jgi:hypothetical protein
MSEPLLYLSDVPFMEAISLAPTILHRETPPSGRAYPD